LPFFSFYFFFFFLTLRFFFPSIPPSLYLPHYLSLFLSLLFPSLPLISPSFSPSQPHQIVAEISEREGGAGSTTKP
jgi:hypothetical protein